MKIKQGGFNDPMLEAAYRLGRYVRAKRIKTARKFTKDPKILKKLIKCNPIHVC